MDPTRCDRCNDPLTTETHDAVTLRGCRNCGGWTMVESPSRCPLAPACDEWRDGRCRSERVCPLCQVPACPEGGAACPCVDALAAGKGTDVAPYVAALDRVQAERDAIRAEMERRAVDLIRERDALASDEKMAIDLARKVLPGTNADSAYTAALALDQALADAIRERDEWETAANDHTILEHTARARDDERARYEKQIRHSASLDDTIRRRNEQIAVLQGHLASIVDQTGCIGPERAPEAVRDLRAALATARTEADAALAECERLRARCDGAHCDECSERETEGAPEPAVIVRVTNPAMLLAVDLANILRWCAVQGIRYEEVGR